MDRGLSASDTYNYRRAAREERGLAPRCHRDDPDRKSIRDRKLAPVHVPLVPFCGRKRKIVSEQVAFGAQEKKEREGE